MGLNLRSLIAKLNDSARLALEAVRGILPVPDSLRRRDRALPDETARFERWRLRLHPETIRGRQVAPVGGADAQPRQTEVRQRAHAGAEPVAAEDVHPGLDHRLDRLRGHAHPHRLHHPGAGLRRGTGAHRARGQQRIAEDQGRRSQEGLPGHRRQFRGKLEMAAAEAAAPEGGASAPAPAARRPTSISTPST